MKPQNRITYAVRAMSAVLIASLPVAAFELSNNQPFIAALIGTGFVMGSMCMFALCAVRVGGEG